MDHEGLTGELDNPFYNATRAEREAKEKTIREAKAAKKAREQETERALVAARREEVRLAKERALGERIQQKATEMQHKLEQEECEKARLEKELLQALKVEQDRAEEQCRNLAEQAALDRKRQEEAERETKANAARALAEKKHQAEAKRLADLFEEERKAEERAVVIQEVRTIKTLQAEAYARGRPLETLVAVELELYQMAAPARQLLIEQLRSELQRPPTPEVSEVEEQKTPVMALLHREPPREDEMVRASRPINSVVLERETKSSDGVRKLRSFEAQNLAKLLDGDMQGVAAQLSSEDPSLGLTRLETFVSRKVAYLGLDGFARELSQGYSTFDLQQCLQLTAKSLADRPGNIPAMVILGLVGFSGNTAYADFVKNLRVIPTMVDTWLGHILASRLFFEYALWSKRKAADDKASGEFVISLMQESMALQQKVDILAMEKQRTACDNKLTELIDAYEGVATDWVVPIKAHAAIMMQYEALANFMANTKSHIAEILVNKEQRKKDSMAKAAARSHGSVVQQKLLESKIRASKYNEQAENIVYEAAQARDVVHRMQATTDAVRLELDERVKANLQAQLALLKE